MYVFYFTTISHSIVSYVDALFQEGLTLDECTHGECAYSLDEPPDNDLTGAFKFSAGEIAGLVVSGLLALFILFFFVGAKIHQVRLRKKPRPALRAGVSLKFENLSYEVKTRQILNGITGEARPGSLMAIMGPSGSGKSTLLEILARKQKEGKLKGNILLNGVQISTKSKRGSGHGYIDQEDLFLQSLTVFETILFSAETRLPESMPFSEKKKRVLDVIHVLGLSHVAQSRIGGTRGRGLSGGEKRRVSVGVELVTDPDILFLDEPTSGLDSYNAHLLIQTLKNLASAGKTILCTIHQPRSDVFAMFDDVLVLSRGRSMFFGPVTDLKSWMISVEKPCPEGYNIADHLLDLAIHYEKYGDTTSSSSTLHYNRLESETDLTKAFTEHHAIAQGCIEDNYSVSLFTQLVNLMKRAMLVVIRKPSLLIAHVLVAVILGSFVGGLYWQSGNALSGLQNKLGSVFFILALIGFSALSAIGVSS